MAFFTRISYTSREAWQKTFGCSIHDAGLLSKMIISRLRNSRDKCTFHIRWGITMFLTCMNSIADVSYSHEDVTARGYSD